MLVDTVSWVSIPVWALERVLKVVLEFYDLLPLVVHCVVAYVLLCGNMWVL